MGGSGSIQLANVFGIRVGVSSSWFLVLFLFIFLLSGSFQDVLDGSDTEAYLVAVASVLLFFTSVVLHELGHAIVAQRNGIKVAGIDLWIFGGMARLSRDSNSPGEEFRIAIAGPLVTLGVVGACWVVGALIWGPSDFWDAARLDEAVSVSPGALIVSWLFSINALLFVFNMLPAFPLDGGRLVKAAIWKARRSRKSGTLVAARVGQVFAVLLIGAGLWLTFAGSLFSGIWLILIAMFMNGAARDEATRTVLGERLGQVSVADIMDHEPVTIPSETTALAALDEYFLRYGWDFFPVTEADGRFLGIARQPAVKDAAEGGRPALAIRELVEPDAAEWRIEQEATLDALIRSEPLRRFGALMAVDHDGALSGVVTLEQVRRALATPS